MRDNAATAANGSMHGAARGGHGANSYHARGTRGDNRTNARAYDRAPFQMSPEMAEDIIEKFAKESVAEEFPLPSRPLSYTATLTSSGTIVAPLSSESVSMPAADTPAVIAATPAVAPDVITPAAVTSAAVTPVTITIRKGRGKATAPTPQATAAAPAAISVPVTPPVVTQVPATPLAPTTAAPQKTNWGDYDSDEDFFKSP